jgi:endonuclease YncB( thermonuclease family)
LANKNKTTYAISKRRQMGMISFALILAAFFVLLDHTCARRKRRTRPGSEEQARAYDLRKYHTKTFMVVNVVDGDTIDIDIPDGNNIHTRVRLWGIDAPETKYGNYGVMFSGSEATRFAKNLAHGKEVQIYLDEGNRTRGKYGRLLAYIKLPDGKFLNEALLSEGFAYADVRFQHSLFHKYQQLEASARSSKKGLWEKVTREQLPQWLQRMKPNLLKK